MTRAFNHLWEQIHASREWGSYPEEALIRFTARNYYKAAPRSAARFLDLGCGSGASTWYLCREGFDVTAIDGSHSAITNVRRRLDRDGYTARLDVGDIVTPPYADATFDCAIEIGCLTCLPAAAAAQAIGEVRRTLVPGGRLLSFTPARGSWGDGLGREVEQGTFVDAQSGTFADLGLVRFSAEEDIARLYSGFASVTIDRVERTVGGRAHTIAQWTIECRR